MSIYFECDDFVVEDLRVELQKYRGPGYPHGWTGRDKYPVHTRELPLKGVVHHQTYGSLNPGPAGPHATFAFETRAPQLQCQICGATWPGSPAALSCPQGHPESGVKNVGGGRGFPSGTYHLMVPFAPLLDAAGRPIIYFCVDWTQTIWHAGAANDDYLAIAWQGKFYSRHLGPTFTPWPGTDGRPSAVQQQLFLGVTTWAQKSACGCTAEMDPTKVFGHFDWGKPACPGDTFEATIRRLRGQEVVFPTPMATSPGLGWRDWMLRQKWLRQLGYNLGPSGADGKPGDYTREAIRQFQVDRKMVADGLWTPDVQQAYDFYAKGRSDL